MLHLIGEVPAVELDFQDGLVQVLKLGEGEYLGKQLKAHRLEMDVLFQAGECHTENLVMVESQMRNVAPAEPIGFVCICIGLDLREFYKGIMRNSDDSFTRIAFDVTESTNLFEKGINLFNKISLQLVPLSIRSTFVKIPKVLSPK